MKLKDFVLAIQDQLSSESKILTDHESPDFKASSKRWSDLGSQVPGAIIRLANEADVVHTVGGNEPFPQSRFRLMLMILWQIREALKASVPFVPATGGHSPWSTIDKDGFILDLSSCKHVAVNASQCTVTVRGGLLTKEFQVALAKEHQFTSTNVSSPILRDNADIAVAVGNGNTVGVIPYFLNGGISVFHL